MTMRKAIAKFNQEFKSAFELSSDCFMVGGNVRVVTVFCPSNQQYLKNILQNWLNRIYGGNVVVIICRKGKTDD